MGALAWRAAAAGALAAGGWALLQALASCGSDDSPAGAAEADARADAEADAVREPPVDAPADHALPPWDPVWHETAPARFEVVPPGPALDLDCGVRCRVIASTRPFEMVSRRARATEKWVVFQTGDGRVPAVNLESGTEYIVGDGSELPEGNGAGGGPSVSGDLVFYGIKTSWGGVMVVRSLRTGELKPVWGKDDPPGILAGTITTAFTYPYAYWEHGPPSAVYRFDLRDGSLAVIPGGQCLILEGSSTGLATCAGEGFVELLDFDTPKVMLVGTKDYDENTGGISPDGKTVVWIDQRDPDAEGKHGSYFSPRGGEVYTLDIETGVETRVTFDSPDNPVVKNGPRLVGDRLAWHSWAGTGADWTDTYDVWQSSGPVWFSIGGEAPRPLRDPSDILGWPQPLESGVVATWVTHAEAGGSLRYLVHIAWPDGDAG